MKTIKSILTLLSAVILISACNKEFLDTVPTASIAEENVFSSSENSMLAINGIHRMMHEGNASGTTTGNYGQGGYPTFCLHLAWMSDDVVWTYDNVMYKFSAQWTHHRDLTHSYNDMNYYWKFFYRVINNANKVIEVYENENLPMTETYSYLALGEAYAYRGFALYQLVQTWASRYVPGQNNTQLGVIIRAEPSADNRPRSSVEECYTQIISDLNDAFDCLENNRVAKVNKSHFDKYVVKGLLARVYLTMGRWQDAADAAQYVISNSGAKLQDNTHTTTINRHSDATNTEWLWALIATADGTQGGVLRSWHNFISNNNASYNRNTPRAILNLLWESIPQTDVRKGLWIKDPYASGITLFLPSNSASRNAPWISQKWVIDDSSTQNAYRDVSYMRLPEIMLIAAEGYAKSGQEDKAKDILYTLVRHRDPAYTRSTSTGNNLTEEIIWQRRVELWAENGLRWLDLKRLDLPVDRGPKPRDGYNQGGTANGWSTSATRAPWNNPNVPVLDPLASNYNMYGEQMPGERARYIERPSRNINWQWLIPIDEIDSNPLCEQNPE